MLLIAIILLINFSAGFAQLEDKISANDAGANDRFGYSVSISGDYAIVGAYGEDPSNVDRAGSAYIFHRSGEDWTQQAKIIARDKAAQDYFGISVSISGDYAIIGAYKENPGGVSDAGSAYIFHRSGAAWTQQAKINADDAEAGDEFGYSVSINGDYAIVGAWHESFGGEFWTGSAYIFHRSGAAWTQQAKINASDAQAGDWFGVSVSISGDYAVVGAYGENLGGDIDAGSAYIFNRSGEEWTQQAKIGAGDAAATDLFGQSVTISGDYVIIGSPGEDPGGVNEAGSAYIFHRLGANWTQQAKINASDAEVDDEFGCSVSICGDYAIVGARLEDPEDIEWAGSAYIFHRFGENWIQDAKIKAGDSQANDYYGYSVSISSDYAIVGAYLEDPEDVGNAGSAYVYDYQDYLNISIPYYNYTMIGIPCTVNDGDAATLFRDDFDDTDPGSRWRLSRWDVENQTYLRYDEDNYPNNVGGDPPDFAPGLGFWMQQIAVDYCVLDILGSQNNGDVPQNTRYNVQLQSRMTDPVRRGINQLANPFRYTYDWRNTSFYNATTEQYKNISDAADANWVNGYAYRWDSDGSQFVAVNFIGDSDYNIGIWEGFWCEVLTSNEIHVRFKPDGYEGGLSPPQSGGNNDAPPFDSPPASEGGWVSAVSSAELERRDNYEDWALKLQVSAADGEYRDMYNKAGINPRSDDNYDHLDAFEFTPMSANYVHLYFPHDWEEVDANRFTYDYRSTDFIEAKVWDFTIKVINLPNREFILNWHNIGDIHYHYFFRLETSEGNLICDLRETDEFSFSSGDSDNEELNYRLVVEYHPEGVEGVSMAVPCEFNLSEPYPNPFNAKTTIRYGLPKPSDVLIEVYDLSGRRIETLINRHTQPGYHSAVLGSDNLASGMYIIKAEASHQVIVRKAILIR